jgi:Entner-Doudoroff aldolase
MPDDFFRRHLQHVPVIAILRGPPPPATVRLARRCWEAGIRLIEVPSQGEPGLAALRAAVQAARGQDALIGAGTVYTMDDARRARAAGASFLVAPGLDADTVRLTQEWRMPYLPGVATPSEVQQAKSLGLQTLKLFPACSLGTGWLHALRGPFPEVGFVAVGGISATNAEDFLSAGAVAVGVGGALDSADTIEVLARLTPRHHPVPSDEEHHD